MCFMTENDGFLIINLREGGSVKLLFPNEIGTEDKTNWEAADVTGGLKPLSFANSETQKITIQEVAVDNTRTNVSVEPTIEKLRAWMRSSPKTGSPPPLQIITTGWQQRCVLSGLTVKRAFFTKTGICIRAYLSLTFDELQSTGLQVEVTPARRSGNSLSGKT